MTFNATVIIPLYNKSKYILRAIDSVLSQQLPVNYIIVVDDGSTDDSALKVTSLENPKITLISQNNQGVSVARNTGIDASITEYVLLLDADDIWLPNFTTEIYKLATKYPDAGMLATAYAFKEKGNIIPAKLKEVPKIQGLLNNYFQSCIKADLPITASSVALKKTKFQVIGSFPIGMKMGEDQLTWSRMAYHFPIAYSNTTSVYYDRTIDDSACKTHLITELAPHIKEWKKDIKDNRVPSYLMASLQQLLHFSALYCVKNNLKLNNKRKARKLLFSEPLIKKDFYWLISVLLTYSPQFIIKRVL